MPSYHQVVCWVPRPAALAAPRLESRVSLLERFASLGLAAQSPERERFDHGPQRIAFGCLAHVIERLARAASAIVRQREISLPPGLAGVLLDTAAGHLDQTIRANVIKTHDPERPRDVRRVGTAPEKQLLDGAGIVFSPGKGRDQLAAPGDGPGVLECDLPLGHVHQIRGFFPTGELGAQIAANECAIVAAQAQVVTPRIMAQPDQQRVATGTKRHRCEVFRAGVIHLRLVHVKDDLAVQPELQVTFAAQANERGLRS